ncbi:DUF885 domain-containing protein [Pseudoteredinibacter isoporae]|uniref:DUF885 domain-containing protein n=1 Tax=Pseudoteredinibacter isoporae TaxID=570281 RepID=UPI003107302C
MLLRQNIMKSAWKLCGVGLLSSAATLASANADQRLETLMAKYWDGYLNQNPLQANLNGDMRHSDKLGRVDDRGRADAQQLLDVSLQQLKTINVDQLSAQQKVNYQLFDWMLRHERRTMDFNWHYYTFTTYAGWHDGFARSAPRVRIKNEQDAKNYIQRLAAFEKFADDNMALMREGIRSANTQPCETLLGYEEGIRGYIKPVEESDFYGPLKNLPSTMDAQTQTKLQADAKTVIAKHVLPKYQAYLDFYLEDYLPACRKIVGISSVEDGAALYDHFVKYYTTVDTDAEAVHKIGLSEVKRIREEMKAIMAEVEFDGDFKAFLDFLRTDPQFYPKTEKGYMAAAAAIAKDMDGKLPEFFSYLPRNPYGIEKVPDQIAPKVTPAYYQRGAADGTRAGKYFLNTYDLKSRALYELPALTLHEAVPGHHLQISIQNELQDLPEFRRFYYFHPFGEGWALYAEYLGEEMGMYNTPYERFGRLTYEMWRALRLVVDTGMHAKGWTRQQAIDFMVNNSALSLHNITTEVDRYITWPGQALAYKMGELKIRELRQFAEKELAEAFDLREFHTKVLTNGAVPLSVLEQLIKEWVAEQKKVS